MEIYQKHKYVHSTDELYAMFTSKKEIKAKHKALGARNISVEECTTDDEGAIVTFVREVPANVPGVLSKFLQPWNVVEQSEEWEYLDGDVYAADLDIDIANVPVTVSGSLELKPTKTGCTNHVRLTVDCGIPFVGKTLVEFVGGDCGRLAHKEYKYLQERLAKNG
ncbi:MAG: DUF2505 domain-containing protein [Woeseiaceae bacterium]|nr:DUF2505 domain-containing protein [Woeseiaceae bacterium]